MQTNYLLAPKQQLALDIIKKHYMSPFKKEPLRMIIQGTAGTGKSYLIDCIRKTINITEKNNKKTLIALAPTRVAAYNIQASTIHTCL